MPGGGEAIAAFGGRGSERERDSVAARNQPCVSRN